MTLFAQKGQGSPGVLCRAPVIRGPMPVESCIMGMRIEDAAEIIRVRLSLKGIWFDREFSVTVILIHKWRQGFQHAFFCGRGLMNSGREGFALSGLFVLWRYETLMINWAGND